MRSVPTTIVYDSSYDEAAVTEKRKGGEDVDNVWEDLEEADSDEEDVREAFVK